MIDASGTWAVPNVLGGDGLPALGEGEHADQITPALPDVLGVQRHRFAGRHTFVVGAGHSAATTLLELATLADTEPGTRVTWVIRSTSPDRAYGGGDADALPARGAIGTRLCAHVQASRIDVVTAFHTHTVSTLPGGGVELTGRWLDGTEENLTADVVVNATGFRPDQTLAAELRLDLDPILGSTRALAPLIDPNRYSCGTVPPHGVDELTHPEPGYYAIGVKLRSRPDVPSRHRIRTARSVVAALARDLESRPRRPAPVPETGVCSSALALDDAEVKSCCGAAAEQPAAAGIGRGLATGLAGGLSPLPIIEWTPTASSCFRLSRSQPTTNSRRSPAMSPCSARTHRSANVAASSSRM